MKAIKSDSDSDSDEQKRSPGFSGKNRGVTPSVAPRVSPTLVTPLTTRLLKYLYWAQPFSIINDQPDL